GGKSRDRTTELRGARPQIVHPVAPLELSVGEIEADPPEVLSECPMFVQLGATDRFGDRISVQQHQQPHLRARVLELTRHFVGHVPAERPPQQSIRSTRAYPPYFRDVVRGHFRNTARQYRPFSDSPRLDAVDRD